MSHAVGGHPDKVNGHHLYRRTLQRHDHIRNIYQCTKCGTTAEHTTDFEVYACPDGGEQA